MLFEFFYSYFTHIYRDVAGSRNSQPLPDWCWDKLSVDLVSAHDSKSKISQYVELLRNESTSANELRRYLTPTALTLLRKSSSPSTWGEIEKIVRKAVGNLGAKDASGSPNIETMSLLNRYWTACVLSKDLDRAKRLEKDFPQLYETSFP